MKITAARPAHRQRFQQEKIGLLDRLLVGPQKERPDFNRRMFDEDFARIFRYSNSRSGNLFEVNTNDQELSGRLLGNVKTRYGPHPVDKAIYELVAEIAQSLVWFGEAYYFLHDDPEKDKTYVASFSSDRVFSFLGLHFQYLPRRNEAHWEEEDKELPREIRFLDNKKLLHFRLPKSIKKILLSQNRVLATLDKYHGTSTGLLLQATHEGPNSQNYFDFRVWREVADQVLYRASRETGWKGRKYDATNRSDFFDSFRLIRFRRNQLKLRDGLLEQLGGELSRAGRFYKSGFHIGISPSKVLPSVRELDELEAKLKLEEVGFSEVSDFCFER